MRLETLDPRAMFALLPYGAMPDDTGEFMLGDVYVNVVLMESDSTKSTINGAGDVDTETWTGEQIAAVKEKVTDGLNWWKDTLYSQFPNTPPNLLNFTTDFTYADHPVHTGYEPINRPSDDFQYWIYDFLHQVGYDQSGSFSTDIRAFNHAQRVEHHTEWAYTIFVVNDANDLVTDTVTPGGFASGGSFTRSFAYSGGRFFVMPAGRPAMSAAHETGHMFWALDEYYPAGSTADKRGYYNTPNSNAATSLSSDQEPSIMSNLQAMQDAWDGHTSSATTLAMVGWKDSDNDGIMDVLDVPFSLVGDGFYNDETGQYSFSGTSGVRTLANRNSSGLQDDITINNIRQAQYKIDDGDWQVAVDYTEDSAFSAAVDLNIDMPLDGQPHTIHIRTYDTRTHVASDEFVGTTTSPSSIGLGGVSGFVWHDTNHDGVYDTSEQPASDLAIQLVDVNGQPLALRKEAIPANSQPGDLANSLVSGATFTSRGVEISGRPVFVTDSPLTGQRVFASTSNTTSQTTTTWNQGLRTLRIDFSTSTTTVSLRAISVQAGSYARLDAYNSSNQVVGRYTTSSLGLGDEDVMTVNRAASDIKYVIARVFQVGLIELSDLSWGPLGSTTTNLLGGYSLPYLPPGDYYVHPVVGSYLFFTTYPNGNPLVSLAAGGSQTINFGYEVTPNPWHNPVKPADVNADGTININDALRILTYMRQHSGGFALEGESISIAGSFLDVNLDGVSDINDVLAVIQKLRQLRLSGGEGETPTGEGADGEDAVVTSAIPVTAPPVHFTNIAGDDKPCTCSSCTAIRGEVLATIPVARGEAPAGESAFSYDEFWQLLASNIASQSEKRTHSSSAPANDSAD